MQRTFFWLAICAFIFVLAVHVVASTGINVLDDHTAIFAGALASTFLTMLPAIGHEWSQAEFARTSQNWFALWLRGRFRDTPRWVPILLLLLLCYLPVNVVRLASLPGEVRCNQGQCYVAKNGQFIRTITMKEYDTIVAQIAAGMTGLCLFICGLSCALLYPVSHQSSRRRYERRARRVERGHR
jgi:hypothetical protein